MTTAAVAPNVGIAGGVALVSLGAALGQLLEELLDDAGIGPVTMFSAAPLPLSAETTASQTSGPRLVVCRAEATASAADRCAAVASWCEQAGANWLSTSIDEEGVIEIGPSFDRTAACYRCFLACRRLGGYGRTAASIEQFTARTALWASLLAEEVIRQVRSTPGRLRAGHSRRCDPWTAGLAELQFARIPGCARCLPTAQTLLTSDDIALRTALTALAFEDYLAANVASATSGNGAASHAAMRLTLQQDVKRLDACPTLALKGESSSAVQLSDASAQPLASASALTSRTIGSLAMWTVGLKSDPGRASALSRWCPSAGNLGSVELYVVVAGDNQELEPGLYFYKTAERCLAALRWRGAHDRSDLLRRILPESQSTPDAAIVLTAAFHRVARKYGPFGYRLMHLDTGVALSQLGVAAAALGISLRYERRWSDELVERELRLDGFNEQAMSIVSVSTRPMPSASWTATIPCADHAPDPDGRRDGAAAPPLGLTIDQALANLIHLGKRRTVATTCAAAGPAVPNDVRIDIPASRLLQMLETRRSIRTFARGGVRLVDIQRILGVALRSYVDRSAVPSDPIKVLALTTGVEGLNDGLYGYDAVNDRLHVVHSACSSETRQALLLQPALCDAPVQFWVAGDLSLTGRPDGAWIYRQLLIRAGIMAHRLSCAAMSIDLMGCIVAGINPQAARSILGLDGWTQCALVTYVCGRKPLNDDAASDCVPARDQRHPELR